MAEAPAFSVIVACKNPGARLHVALDSVWHQRGVDAELVVIDGGSGDGTSDWLAARRSQMATLISGPDAGVYDGLNKGVAAAQGEWLVFLGADDRLMDDRVLREAAQWIQRTDAGVIAGEAVYDDGRIYRLHSHVNPLARNFVHHQAAFYRRSLFEENGGFDVSLGVMADYDFNVRLWKNRVRFKPIPLRIAACGTGGISDAGGWRGYREEIAVRHRYFSPFRCLFWDALSVIRFLRKKALRTFLPHG